MARNPLKEAKTGETNMPKLLKHRISFKGSNGNVASGQRRLSYSRSMGDLTGLLTKEFHGTPLVPSVSAEDLTKKSDIALEMETSVICGYLYRLTNTGIWFKLWVELRFNYLLCFYDRLDFLPMDMINLSGFTVSLAPECDHLEELYPVKIESVSTNPIFFYADTADSRAEWINAFRACAEQKSLNIEALSLEWKPIEIKEKRHSEGSSTLSSNQEDIEGIIKFCLNSDDDSSNSSAEDTVGNLPNSQVKAEDIFHKYDRAVALTEFEALRLQTQLNQRRMSAQVKMETIQNRPRTGSVTMDVIQGQLKELHERLNDIDQKIEKTEKVTEQVIHNLETKKIKELESLHCDPDVPHEEQETKVREIKEKTSTGSESPDSATDSDASGKPKRKPPRLRIRRQKTFSHGDFIVTPSPPVQKTKPLRKADSLSNLFRMSSKDDSAKRKSPLRLISNVVRHHSHKNRPEAAEKEAPAAHTTQASSEVIRRHKDHHHKGVRSFFRHSSYEPQSKPASSVDHATFHSYLNSEGDLTTPECSPDPVSPGTPDKHPKKKSHIRRIFSFSTRHRKDEPNNT